MSLLFVYLNDDESSHSIVFVCFSYIFLFTLFFTIILLIQNYWFNGMKRIDSWEKNKITSIIITRFFLSNEKRILCALTVSCLQFSIKVTYIPNFKFLVLLFRICRDQRFFSESNLHTKIYVSRSNRSGDIVITKIFCQRDQLSKTFYH